MSRMERTRKNPKDVQEAKWRADFTEAQRFISEGNNVSRVLNHLPSLIFHKHVTAGG